MWCIFEKMMDGKKNVNKLWPFKYVVMHFGLPNALNVFQHFMNDIFHEYLYYFMVCYINDIVIFSNNMNYMFNLFWTSLGKLNFT